MLTIYLPANNVTYDVKHLTFNEDDFDASVFIEEKDLRNLITILGGMAQLIGCEFEVTKTVVGKQQFKLPDCRPIHVASAGDFFEIRFSYMDVTV